MAVVQLTQDTFDEAVLEHDLLVIDFWAQWCGPCKAFAPVFEEVAKVNPDALFAKVDIEHEQELANDFKIMSVPMLMILREQVIVFAHSGVIPATALQDLVNQARALDMDKVRAELNKD